MAEGGPPEISEQKKQITPLLQKTLIKGETWYHILNSLFYILIWHNVTFGIKNSRRLLLGLGYSYFVLTIFSKPTVA